jgi:cytoskeletal protein CcmA (bactofilin family)
MRIRSTKETGSVLIWTVLVITILSLAAAELLHVTSAKYNTTLHAATWQEALLAAESGVDLALRELRRTLFPDANPAWHGWTATPANGVTSYGLTTIPNAGLAGTEMRIKINVDAPAELRDASNSWQYYRVRAIGTMPLTGPARASDNKQDTLLRKFTLRGERFAGTSLAPDAFTQPQVSRRVEAIIKPVSAFDQAIISAGALDLTDQNIVIDSYDSRDPAKSTTGLYDPLKRQYNGNIATNGQIINAGNARVYGDVATNSGTVTGVANVTGAQRTDFYQDLRKVLAPNDPALGTQAWGSVNPSPTTVSGNTNLPAHATEGSWQSRYVVSAITLAGTQKLTFTGNADGSTTYVEIYVTGTVDATGNAEIIVEPGVKAKIYASGTVKIAGNGIINRNGQPGNLLIYGITPADGSPRSMEIGGNTNLSAAVYAPGYDVQINNGGTRGSVYGSFVGKTVKMNGVTDLHYDEALGAGGAISNYKIASWFEDAR